MSAPVLRPYQVEAVDGARAQLAAGKKRCLIIMPTGGGKTVVASEIIHRAEQRGSRTLFLAHRRELIAQTSEKLTRFGVRHGIIMGSERRALQHLVQVASVQTLARHQDLLSHVDLIFFDEAHHAAAGSYTKILEWYPKARVVGLTATPWRLDGRGLADVFDGHVIVRTPKQLRDEGYLVPVGGWAFEAIDTTKARVQGGDFKTKDLVDEAAKPRVVGDIVEEWLRHGEGARTIVFTVSIEVSKLLTQKFRDAGVAAEHLDGEMGKTDRDAVVARLRSGATRVVCNCNVLTEGFDLPELEVCVLARPTLSTSLYLQMVGRVLRPAPGKTVARIHDHSGCLAAHGHPYAHRDYSPETSTKGDREDIEDLKQTAKRSICASCKSVRALYPCDHCGYQPTPQELHIEFEEAAHARAILEENSPEKLKERQMAAQFRAKPEGERRAYFERMVAKHGPRKAIGVYRWWSGETAWPDRAWRLTPSTVSHSEAAP